MKSHFIPHAEINLRSSFREFEIIPTGIVMVNSVCLLDWVMSIQMFGLKHYSGCFCDGIL